MSSLEARRFNHLASAIRAASGEPIITIERLVAEVASMRVAEMALARRTEVTRAERRCPHCGTAGAHLHGKNKNGRQRFRCRITECRRTFNILTGTPMARARKPEMWGHYLSHMTNHRSVRQILSGVIEADETFFVRSCQGHRGWVKGRPPEPRAGVPGAPPSGAYRASRCRC